MRRVNTRAGDRIRVSSSVAEIRTRDKTEQAFQIRLANQLICCGPAVLALYLRQHESRPVAVEETAEIRLHSQHFVCLGRCYRPGSGGGFRDRPVGYSLKPPSFFFTATFFRRTYCGSPFR